MTNVTNWCVCVCVGWRAVGVQTVCVSIWQCPVRDIRDGRQTMSTMVANPAAARRPPARLHQVKSPFFPPTEEEQRGRAGRGASGGSHCCVQVLGEYVGSLLLKMWPFHGGSVSAPAMLKWNHSSLLLQCWARHSGSFICSMGQMGSFTLCKEVWGDFPLWNDCTKHCFYCYELGPFIFIFCNKIWQYSNKNHPLVRYKQPFLDLAQLFGKQQENWWA